ncbi:MAG TPA: LysR family transcriptional regulator [Burkholderiales bacterium]|nr:LysR family transcriptional regulator [Burkholderiales bacterium]
MDKLRAMETFVRIVERGSLTAAADALDTSLPSVVRGLAALEAELDVRLLNRTTRRIALTDEGREYYERCRRVLAEVDEAEAVLSARRAAPKGRLRVTAPVMFGRMHVAPVANELLARHAALELELVLLDRVVDLLEEGVDVAVRIGRLPDSSLVAVPVGHTRRVLCASPAYLKRAGTPKSSADLAPHRFVSFTGLAPAQEGKPVLASNQIDVALDACLAGVGIGEFLCYQVQALLAAGRLKRVPADPEPTALPIQVVYPHARLLSTNLRAFVDWTVPRLRRRLAQAPRDQGTR